VERVVLPRELVRQELVRQELVRQELVRQELVRQELVRQELVRRELVRRELSELVQRQVRVPLELCQPHASRVRWTLPWQSRLRVWFQRSFFCTPQGWRVR
jgi:hypothetical protein